MTELAVSTSERVDNIDNAMVGGEFSLTAARSFQRAVEEKSIGKGWPLF
jgi:hypothetical protein